MINSKNPRIPVGMGIRSFLWRQNHNIALISSIYHITISSDIVSCVIDCQRLDCKDFVVDDAYGVAVFGAEFSVIVPIEFPAKEASE
jgi:hypothetical protein